MRRRPAVAPSLLVTILASLAWLASPAAALADPATTNRLALEMSGVRYGLVVAHAQEGQVLLTTPDVAPSLAALVGTFTQGKPVKRDLRLSTGALLKKTNDARLVSVRLPALGQGGAPDVELAFAATPLVTQPVLSAKESPPPPPAARIAEHRIDIAGMRASGIPRLDAVTLTQKPDGTATIGPVAFEAGPGGAAPFAAWQKSQGGHPAPRAVRIEYVANDGTVVLHLDLDRCIPASVVPQGASGTTRVVLACGRVTAS